MSSLIFLVFSTCIFASENRTAATALPTTSAFRQEEGGQSGKSVKSPASQVCLFLLGKAKALFETPPSRLPFSYQVELCHAVSPSTSGKEAEGHGKELAHPVNSSATDTTSCLTFHIYFGIFIDLHISYVWFIFKKTTLLRYNPYTVQFIHL